MQFGQGDLGEPFATAVSDSGEVFVLDDAIDAKHTDHVRVRGALRAPL
jgi:hypothetical protein